MSYQDTLDFLFNQLANYHKSGGKAYKPGLERIELILSHLNNPHSKFKSIHIAGTNGKGSVSHMMASILQEAGFKTGLFTSPHLIDFRERIKVNGQLIPEARVVSFVDSHKVSLSSLNASFFEWTWAMACEYFASEEVDFVVVEVGLGGRLDATNIIEPIVTAITSIGLDHVAMLGDSLKAIAKEKAGIIKQNVPLVLGEIDEEPIIVIQNIAMERDAQVYYKVDKKVETDLEGAWQGNNAQLAYRIAELLGISEKKVRDGLQKVKDNTGIIGRLQLVSSEQRIYCDTAHNADGWRVIVNHFKNMPLQVILGFVDDKDIDKIIAELPDHWTYYICEPNSNRAYNAEKVAYKFVGKGLNASILGDLRATFGTVMKNLQDDETLLVGGSNYLIGDFLKII